MGPSRTDPARQVGVFNTEFIARLPALRAQQMETFRWIAGEWNYENLVPATRLSPAYTDVGSYRFSRCEKDAWICVVAPDGREAHHITFDPFSQQWIYVLTQGSYGIRRSRAGWRGNQIVLSGLMTMLGIDCDWRMTGTKHSDDEFAFVNEERVTSGAWEFIDEWRFRKK